MVIFLLLGLVDVLTDDLGPILPFDRLDPSSMRVVTGGLGIAGEQFRQVRGYRDEAIWFTGTMRPGRAIHGADHAAGRSLRGEAIAGSSISLDGLERVRTLLPETRDEVWADDFWRVGGRFDGLGFVDLVADPGSGRC